ncbi:hypothetical protein EFY87_04490 [Flexivirga caeni]|uniref:Uncharacterized protein n=1 Tax=Flexivirga caeni TaxID=2294115 RepID=A0A3M9MH85_9MICO|nr:hypothetical protein EFY87_04490 [Flexivirga caeni]
MSSLRQHYFQLLGDPLAFIAEASALLAVVDPRSIPSQEPGPPDLDALLDLIIADACVETTALLRVVAQLAPAPYAARAAEAAAQRDDPVLPWVAALNAAQVTGSATMRDVFGDGITYVFEVQAPQLPVMSMLVYVDRRRGGAVGDAFIVGQSLEAVHREIAHDPDLTDVVWSSVDQAAARGLVEAGIELSASLETPMETESWPALRALTDWVLRMLPPAQAPQQPALTAADRHRLISEFVASEEWAVTGLDVRDVTEMLIDFSINYGTGDPLEWSPRGVDDFLGWWSEHTLTDDLDDAMPEVVLMWVQFAWERKELGRRLTGDALAEVEDLVYAFAFGPEEDDYEEVDYEDDEDEPEGGTAGWANEFWFDPYDLGFRAPRIELDRDELAVAVGGDDALAALTDEPLPADEKFDLSKVPEPMYDLVTKILDHIDRGSDAYEVIDTEICTAQRRLLARAVREAPEWFAPTSKAPAAAHAICWLIGRGNDLLGPDRLLTASALEKAVGSGSGRQRAARLQELLRMPTGRGGILLGDPRLLVREVRTQLIELRDLR